MSDLGLAFDPSSSLSKGLYGCNSERQIKLMTMEPSVINIPESAIEKMPMKTIEEVYPHNEAWVRIKGEYYAVGFLARTGFYGYDNLKELKYENAVPKVLAMVGAIAQTHRFLSEFTLTLGVLLPYGEYQDRSRFEKMISSALSQFVFRGKNYRVKLEKFHCMPEGAGVLLRGANPKQDPREKNTLVVMLGYRNISYLLRQRGTMTSGETEDLGFSWLLGKVKERTSGLKSSELIVPITLAGKTVKKTALKTLAKSHSPSQQPEVLEEIKRAVESARNQHWTILSKWLSSRRFPEVDEVILAGGTSAYYRAELEVFFSPSPCDWGDRLENSIKELVGDKRWSQEFRYRLTDVFGYYCYLQYLSRKQTIKAN